MPFKCNVCETLGGLCSNAHISIQSTSQRSSHAQLVKKHTEWGKRRWSYSSVLANNLIGLPNQMVQSPKFKTIGNQWNLTKCTALSWILFMLYHLPCPWVSLLHSPVEDTKETFDLWDQHSFNILKTRPEQNHLRRSHPALQFMIQSTKKGVQKLLQTCKYEERRMPTHPHFSRAIWEEFNLRPKS